MKSSARGFTLIELVVVMAITAIVIGFGLPSFRTFTATQRVKSASGDFAIAATFARSEAIKRNTTVTMAAAGSNWQDGWSISSSAGTLATQPAYSGVVTKTFEKSVGGSLIAVTVAPPIVYLNTGRLSAADSPHVQVEGSSDAPDAPKRCISFDLSGMPKTRKEACS